MRIDIAWSDNAIALLDNIYRFYSKKSQTAAIRLYNKLLDSAEPLRVLHGYRRTNRNPCRVGLPLGRMAPARNVQIIFVKRQQNTSQFIFT